MKPAREHATNNGQTYFVTSDTWERRALFRTESWARLFFQNLLAHRNAYLLHEFVLMPDHFHLLLTPQVPLERAIQFVKGGFSYRVKREIGSGAEIWRRGFADHRIREMEDYDRHVHYVHLNPVKKHLCSRPEEYRYSSAYPGWKLDPIPQGLKPADCVQCDGTAEAVPFQNAETKGLGTMPRKNNILNIVAVTASVVTMAVAAHAQVRTPEPFHLARVRGVYVDATGNPVPGATVTLDRNDRVAGSTTTDNAGDFEIKGFTGHYSLHVKKPGYSMVSREVVVGEAAAYLTGERLYIIAGPGACSDDCSQVFTSRAKFDKAIRKNTGHQD